MDRLNIPHGCKIAKLRLGEGPQYNTFNTRVTARDVSNSIIGAGGNVTAEMNPTHNARVPYRKIGTRIVVVFTVLSGLVQTGEVFFKHLGRIADSIQVIEYASKWMKIERPTPSVAPKRSVPTIPNATPIDSKYPAPTNLRMPSLTQGPPVQQSPTPLPVWNASAE